MHSLLIVDDDDIIREGIEKNIDWAAHKVTVVGTARNGMECLEQIKTCIPEVVLSDIRMPFLDGLQLTEAIAKLYPQIKVVLLTAYDDFQYAKKALDLRVQQYVMKYDDNEVICSAVLKAFEEYDRQQNNSEIIQKSCELLQNQYLCGLLTGDAGQKDTQKSPNLIDLRFPNDCFCVAAADIGGLDGQADVLKTELALEKIRLYCEKMLNGYSPRIYDVIFNHRVVFLFNPQSISPEELQHTTAALGQMAESVFRHLQENITFGLGNIHSGMESIPRSYFEAVQSLELKNYLMPAQKENRVIQINTVRNFGNSHYQIIEQVTAFIEQNYEEKDLSLNHIARAVHVSSTYISMLFKKYKGINLTEYITNIRIKKAAELLSGTNMKTYEISERVGYPNSQYFSVIFKKYKGLSPTEYRHRQEAT